MSLCLPNNDEFLNVTVVGGVSGTEAGTTQRLTGIEESFPPLLLIFQCFSPSSRAHSHFAVSSPRLVLLACFLLPFNSSLWFFFFTLFRPSPYFPPLSSLGFNWGCFLLFTSCCCKVLSNSQAERVLTRKQGCRLLETRMLICSPQLWGQDRSRQCESHKRRGEGRQLLMPEPCSALWLLYQRLLQNNPLQSRSAGHSFL